MKKKKTSPAAAMGMRRNHTTTARINSMVGWVHKQSKMVQVGIMVSIVIGTLVGLHMVLHTDYFFIISEVMYTISLLVLVYKLTTHKNCSGLSLKTQDATAILLVARLICGTVGNDMELDLHVVLDSVSLISTLWVIYTMRFKLQSTYIKELDNFNLYFLVVPCLILALLVNPYSRISWAPSIISILWAFCTYLGAVLVFPQLRLIQNAKIVEPFTAHYVFALGLARFFGFAHWVIVIYETRGRSLLMIAKHWYLWLPMTLIAELVQTFILADFCYYYVISVLRGKQMSLPLPV